MHKKIEWRKKEKSLYLPKNKPELINVPELSFITLSGEGSPNEPLFTEKIGALYALAYTIKMTLKQIKSPPQDYIDFTVYPLEGIWDINDEAKKTFNGKINKDDLVYKLMIRQPSFVTTDFFTEMLEIAKQKKSNPLLDDINFEQITDGQCVQMLHLGKFEDEAHTFDIMESYCEEQGSTRLSNIHREVYLSDTRKVEPDKLKTVLRFQVS